MLLNEDCASKQENRPEQPRPSVNHGYGSHGSVKGSIGKVPFHVASIARKRSERRVYMDPCGGATRDFSCAVCQRHVDPRHVRKPPMLRKSKRCKDHHRGANASERLALRALAFHLLPGRSVVGLTSEFKASLRSPDKAC